MKQLSLLSSMQAAPPATETSTGTPSEIGALAELAVASGLCKAGYAVYTPLFNSHGRVGLLAESEAGVRRLQCRPARLVGGGVIAFTSCSQTGGVDRDYVGDIDDFGVYSPDTGLVYLVPIELAGARLTCLRLAPTRNHQRHGIRWAEDFVLGPPW